MSDVKPGDRARVTTTVAVPPSVAFEVFTRDIERWWRQGVRFRLDGAGGYPMRFEGTVGGHLVVGTGADRFEIGRVLVWEPGERLVFEWRTKKFAPTEKTEVDVRFEAVETGTRVVLEHRGFAQLADDHVVRHGLQGQAFAAMMGLWWGDLLTSFRGQAK